MKHLLLTAALIAAPFAASAQSAKEIVLDAVDSIFINPNPEVAARLFADDYRQHNPMFPDGKEVPVGFASKPIPGFKYEIGNVVADEEAGLVVVHFRAEGFGPNTIVGFDMFKVEEGQITAHWDVIQDEVPADQTASGNPMWTPAGE